MKRIAEASPGLKARIAGVFYLLTILMGVVVLFAGGRWGLAGDLIDLLAGACYMAVTLLFYDMFKPVNKNLSLLAALFSVAGFTIGRLGLHPQGVDLSLVLFGFYCLVIGYLIYRSAFLPRILSALMAFAGVAWLTFLSPPHANYLAPYNLAGGGVAELSLCLWLLVIGVNVQRWKEQASAAGEWRS
jgi:hypothetical protein